MFKNYADFIAAQNGEYSGVTFGTGGLATQKAFEGALCRLKNAHTTKASPFGISAIINTLMAFTESDDEALLCDNVYGSTARFCHIVLANKYGVKMSMLVSNMGAEIEAPIAVVTGWIVSIGLCQT